MPSEKNSDVKENGVELEENYEMCMMKMWSLSATLKQMTCVRSVSVCSALAFVGQNCIIDSFLVFDRFPGWLQWHNICLWPDRDWKNVHRGRQCPAIQ